ncbi:hypothetical protein Q8A67_024926 [Cirrhinus molitorella]|uniref:Uncharacterized protein n=1 Tax=Cirrhinus molitorella TaxID=172907 RepID=A0AA88P5H4_9TELE|nr:hypothetical protein Q8A67_024926 [Cirrhinus molitorella]
MNVSRSLKILMRSCAARKQTQTRTPTQITRTQAQSPAGFISSYVQTCVHLTHSQCNKRLNSSDENASGSDPRSTTLQNNRAPQEKEMTEMRATAAGRAAGVQRGAGGAERSGMRRSDG